MDVKGSHNAEGCRFAIIVSRFNEEITSGLLKGARGALAEASVRDEDVTVIHVPGAFEIPVTARRVADQGTVDAVIGLGCLIKGDTMHFEYIAAAASQGMMDVSTSTGIPVAFGVLTAMTDRQAEERSADGPGNKGREAALAAVEMATLFRLLGGPEVRLYVRNLVKVRAVRNLVKADPKVRAVRNLVEADLQVRLPEDARDGTDRTEIRPACAARIAPSCAGGGAADALPMGGGACLDVRGSTDVLDALC